jgi:hypothetical protein
MKPRHAAALALLLVAFTALLVAALFPPVRWEAVWTMIALVLVEIVQMAISHVRQRN